MAFHTARRTAFALPILASLLGGTAARADLTAEQVWQSWQDYYTSVGGSIDAGSTERAGDTLTLGDVTMTLSGPEGTTTATLDRVRMIEQRGAVQVMLPASIPLVTSGTSEKGETVESRMTATQSGLDLRVSGNPDAIAYDMAADSIAATLDQVTVDGKPLEMTMRATAHRATARAMMAGQDDRAIDYSSAADRVDFAMDVTDPENGGTFGITGDVAQVTGGGAMRQPAGTTDLKDMTAALAAGLTVEGRYSYGESRMDFALDDAGNSAKGSLASQSGTGSMSMTGAALDYRLENAGNTIHLEGAQIPFPVDLSLGRMVAGLGLPLSDTGAAQPFHLETRLIDLTVNDAVWALIDPQASLPRDPATLIVDLKGMAKVMGNLLMPDPASPPDAVPGEIEALDLNELKLTIAGAALTGKGAFTFDNSDMTTFEGMPRPEGAVDLHLLGGNGLLDKLIALGLLPAEQGMGVRMMAGLFAKSGPGEDELSSRIEVRPDGGLYANGQRLR
ncbi:hypothetical protein V8J36_03700 [Frigidibacter sp. MR17.14]|uniref:hypothetical protein n=1 Tax=Frigidibacter sp. MR17.14 TaxID=3126509 RepID=UPI003012CF26